MNELFSYFAPAGPNAFFAPSQYLAQLMNIGFLDGRTTFGFPKDWEHPDFVLSTY